MERILVRALFFIFPFLISSALGTEPPLELSHLTLELLESARNPKFFDWLVRARRKLHENPELSFEEFETSQFIRTELESLGINFTWPVAKTGIVASIGSGAHPWFALRADMDALPIQEMVEWEHKSKKDGKMHACGHDAHVTMLLGAAKLLQQRRNELKGTVKLVFQPGEEGRAGAYHMLKEGALDKFQGIFGLHIIPDLPIGTIGSRAGPFMAGSGRFQATIQGIGGHAAWPHKARDPVLAMSSAIVSLQHIISRETDPLDSRVITVGFVKGGQAGNVIPETATFGGTFRSMTVEGLSYLQKRIQEVQYFTYASKLARTLSRINVELMNFSLISQTRLGKRIIQFGNYDARNCVALLGLSHQVIEVQAAVHQCNATVDFMEDKLIFYPATVNDEGLYSHAKKVGEHLLGGESNVHHLSMVMAAEDFSFYSQKMPAAFFMIGVKNETMKSGTPLHSPYITIDERVLPVGAALHAAVAISYLDEHSVGSN